MTLSVGNHVVKLDHAGKPIMGDNASEVHVEYEITEIVDHDYANDLVTVKMKKVR